MAVAPWIVSDELWEVVEPLLPVWERLHELLLARLRAAGEIEWARAVADASHVQAKRGAPRRARARLTGPETAPSTISWSTRAGSRSPGRSPAATATTSPS